MITRFSVPNLHETTIHLTNVVNGKIVPDKILINAKILSTYTDTILENKEIWISKGRIACIRNNNDHKNFFNTDKNIYGHQIEKILVLRTYGVLKMDIN